MFARRPGPVAALMSAQSIGEYGGTGAGILGTIGDVVASTFQRVADSLEQDTRPWGGGICLLVFAFVVRRSLGRADSVD